MSSKIAVSLMMSVLAHGVSLAVSTAYAQDAQKVINAATIVTDPPLEFKDPKSGELTGFDHELFDAMAKKAGAKVNWSDFAWADQASFAPLKTGRVDIETGVMGDTAERREIGVSFVDFMYDAYYFYTLSADASQF